MNEPTWEWHCAAHAAEHVREVAGRDVWSGLGGCPTSWREAADLYRRLGVTNLKDTVTAVLGPPIEPKRAMRNDLAMIDGALGIVRGEWVECLDQWQPISKASCAWRIHGG